MPAPPAWAPVPTPARPAGGSDPAVRVVYCGTPSDAVPGLRAVVEAGHEVALVLTQPDRRRGRGGTASASPVKAAALELGLAVRTPDRVSDVEDEVRALDAEVGVVVAFGQLLPVGLLDATRHGFVNLHFSLLPRWRGAAPVERAVLAGDDETGVCVMQLEEGLDTGPIYACTRTPIRSDETAGELRGRLVDLGTDLLVRTLPAVPIATPEAQVGEATHAQKLRVEEFRIDPSRPAAELSRVVRAGNPRPGAWGIVDGHRVKVWRARVSGRETDAPGSLGTVGPDGGLVTGEGVLVLEEVQPEGKRTMDAGAWLAGRRGPGGAAPRFEGRFEVP
jgi:methionyl-tRNA formyltransferase